MRRLFYCKALVAIANGEVAVPPSLSFVSLLLHLASQKSRIFSYS
jgi:hypothetical protein